MAGEYQQVPKSESKKFSIKRIVRALFLTSLLLLLVYSFFFLPRTMSFSRLCGKCHVIRPEYITWQNSPHRRVPCFSCHQQGWRPLQLVKPVMDFYRTRRGNYSLPVTIKVPIESRVCLQCHPFSSLPRRLPNLKFDHNLHQSKGITCVACHNGTAHGLIAERGLTDGSGPEKTEADWRKAMSSTYVRVNMRTCTGCHQLRRLPDDCRLCHVEVKRPADHDQRWLENHGREAEKNLARCDKCHGEKALAWERQDIDTVIAYTKKNSYCLDCHRREPPSHSGNWVQNHGAQAQIRRQDCLVCHRERFREDDDPDEIAATTTCWECH